MAAILSRPQCDKGPVLHIETSTKWPTFCRQHFQMYFAESNVFILIEISLSFVPEGLIILSHYWFR